MKAILTEGAITVRRVTITKYRGVIMVNVDTEQKWPECSYSSTIGPGDYQSQTIQLEVKDDNLAKWTLVELIPETDEEHYLMRHSFLTLACSRYGPTYLFTPQPTQEEMADQVDVFEDATEAKAAT